MVGGARGGRGGRGNGRGGRGGPRGNSFLISGGRAPAFSGTKTTF
jgi:hypothetical protein